MLSRTLQHVSNLRQSKALGRHSLASRWVSSWPARSRKLNDASSCQGRNAGLRHRPLEALLLPYPFWYNSLVARPVIRESLHSPAARARTSVRFFLLFRCFTRIHAYIHMLGFQWPIYIRQCSKISTLPMLILSPPSLPLSRTHLP